MWITNRLVHEVNKFFLVYLFMDRDSGRYLQLIDTDKQRQLDELVNSNSMRMEDHLSYSVINSTYQLFHPENIARLMAMEKPFICMAVLGALSPQLREMILFYMPEEKVVRMRSSSYACDVSFSYHIASKFIEREFARLEGVNRKLQDEGREGTIKRLLFMDYEEIFRFIKEAGNMALRDHAENTDRFRTNFDAVFAGHLLLSAFISSFKNDVQETILMKFSIKSQEVMRKFICEGYREIEWLKQKSENVFQRILKKH